MGETVTAIPVRENLTESVAKEKTVGGAEVERERGYSPMCKVYQRERIQSNLGSKMWTGLIFQD